MIVIEADYGATIKKYKNKTYENKRTKLCLITSYHLIWHCLGYILLANISFMIVLAAELWRYDRIHP